MQRQDLLLAIHDRLHVVTRLDFNYFLLYLDDNYYSRFDKSSLCVQALDIHYTRVFISRASSTSVEETVVGRGLLEFEAIGDGDISIEPIHLIIRSLLSSYMMKE